jgi:protein-S-isoprenylcysteine O-methyltransferase Ste14
MSLSIGERILVPGIGAALFAIMSRGFMAVVGGSTRRMKTVLLCAILFMTAFAYAVFWQDKLAELFAWKDVWKAVVGICAVGAVFLCRILQARQARESHSNSDEPGQQ